MATSYFEMRPVFLGEVAAITAAVAGTGSLVGWTFSGHLWDASGNEVAGAVAVAILDPVARTLTVTVAGQNAAGDYSVGVRRTDDGSDLLVVRGVVEATDPAKL